MKISELYRKFSAAEGSQHIASEYAILKIQELISRFKVKNVLEVGLGIGSIAGTILEVNKDLKYSGTEKNDFCLDSLKVNLENNHQRLEIYGCIENISKNKRFDLVIIDGKDRNLEALKELVSNRAILAVEGDRISQQEILQEMFPDSIFVHSISRKKNRRFSPFPSTNWQGGIKVIFIKPSLSQRMWWLSEKSYTKIKYIYRDLVKT